MFHKIEAHIVGVQVHDVGNSSEFQWDEKNVLKCFVDVLSRAVLARRLPNFIRYSSARDGAQDLLDMNLAAHCSWPIEARLAEASPLVTALCILTHSTSICKRVNFIISCSSNIEKKPR
jgi:hypothetical protein